MQAFRETSTLTVRLKKLHIPHGGSGVSQATFLHTATIFIQRALRDLLKRTHPQKGVPREEANFVILILGRLHELHELVYSSGTKILLKHRR